MSTPELPLLPVGDRFKSTNEFRLLGTGGGDCLYEAWGKAIEAYATAAVVMERERCATIAEVEGSEWHGVWGSCVQACEDIAAAIRGTP